jgi:hypothetical protein
VRSKLTTQKRSEQKATTAKKKASKKAKTEAKGDDEVAEPSASEVVLFDFALSA